jgi:hypothetical protein
MAKKKAAGTNDPNTKKDLYLKVKLTSEERKMVKMAAAECEMSISDFMHGAIMACAERDATRYYQREIAPRRKPRQPRSKDS